MEALNAIKFFLLLALHWIPRILGVLIAIFFCLFSFDVFGQNTGFRETLIAFLMHNIPTIIIILFLILSWKWPWIGGLSSISLAIVYLIYFSDRSDSHIIDFALFIMGILFLLDWFLRKYVKQAQEAYWGNNK
jgi:hypothetical protein